MKIIIRSIFVLLALFSMFTANAELLVAGKVVGRHILGLANDVNGDPLMVDEKPIINDTFMFNKTLIRQENLFAISGFGNSLGSLYVTRYDTDLKRYVDTSAVELASVNGLNRPRGGIATAWTTVLFAESQQIDSTEPKKFVDEFRPFYKGKAELVNPYNYGWVAEAVILDDAGDAKVIKNYSVGRVFASQLFMMPDGKSLYLFDKDNAGLLYLYVASEANSLADGVLYGVSIENGKPVYDELGHSSALRMKFRMKQVKNFKKLFDKKPLADGKCPRGFELTEGVFGKECIKLNKRNRKYFGLFEPARMLAIKRKGRQLSRFSDITFNKDNTGITLIGKDGNSVSYSLGKNKGMGSTFIIQDNI